ncbi:MAG: sugar ABC transporter permease [Clostridia bacterium]|nr:sugar ABC transporter permease [Clostridia bacterium]
MKLKKKKRGIEANSRRAGRLFILPWEIGMVIFIIVPLLISVAYAFCEVTFKVGGMDYHFVLFDNFKYLLKEDPYYTDTLISSLTTLIYTIPIIVALSLILGIVLNQKFKGRVIMRAVFFLPVIIAAGVVLNILTTQINGQPPVIQLGATSTTMSDGGGYLDASALLAGLRLPEAVTEMMAKYITMIFNLLWRSGIQIILFISGLQTIPDSLYEVSKIEGASKWEEFWMITFPMLRDVTLLVTVFTVVEEMVSTANPVMSNAQSMISGQQRYDMPTAMIWFYFLCVLIICGIVLFPIFRSFKRKWD